MGNQQTSTNRKICLTIVHNMWFPRISSDEWIDRGVKFEEIGHSVFLKATLPEGWKYTVERYESPSIYTLTINDQSYVSIKNGNKTVATMTVRNDPHDLYAFVSLCDEYIAQ